jgi:hypothetical protein
MIDSKGLRGAGRDHLGPLSEPNAAPLRSWAYARRRISIQSRSKMHGAGPRGGGTSQRSWAVWTGATQEANFGEFPFSDVR